MASLSLTLKINTQIHTYPGRPRLCLGIARQWNPGLSACPGATSARTTTPTLAPIGNPSKRKTLITQQNRTHQSETNVIGANIIIRGIIIHFQYLIIILPDTTQYAVTKTTHIHKTKFEELRQCVQHLGFGEGGEEFEVEMRIGFGLVGFGDGVFVIAPFPHHVVEFVCER